MSNQSFPFGLGPFGVVSSSLRPKIPNLKELNSASSCCYQIELKGKFKTFGDLGLADIGQLSPLYPVTLSDEDKIKANIPSNAKKFLWAYTLAGVSQLSDEGKEKLIKDDPDFALLLFGGYIYLDEKGDIAGVNAICPGEGLFFSGPQRWKHTNTRELYRAGRFQPITIHSMKAQGATHFCWIGPNEVIYDDKGQYSLLPNNKYGAFVYLFGEDTSTDNADNVYFVIVEGKKS
eukprot:c18328_g1_i1.p1 GENE.c18328_g1_i1~~c18328_g1_i1.p1  ORF type:complete len:233 (-),score=88.73 c18328_g1_i1:118-816(-)